jgi:hypothetical protein
LGENLFTFPEAFYRREAHPLPPLLGPVFEFHVKKLRREARSVHTADRQFIPHPSNFILSLSSVVGESVLNFGAIVGAMLIGSGETLVIQPLTMTLVWLVCPLDREFGQGNKAVWLT